MINRLLSTIFKFVVIVIFSLIIHLFEMINLFIPLPFKIEFEPLAVGGKVIPYKSLAHKISQDMQVVINKTTAYFGEQGSNSSKMTRFLNRVLGIERFSTQVSPNESITFLRIGRLVLAIANVSVGTSQIYYLYPSNNLDNVYLWWFFKIVFWCEFLAEPIFKILVWVSSFYSDYQYMVKSYLGILKVLNLNHIISKEVVRSFTLNEIMNLVLLRSEEMHNLYNQYTSFRKIDNLIIYAFAQNENSYKSANAITSVSQEARELWALIVTRLVTNPELRLVLQNKISQPDAFLQWSAGLQNRAAEGLKIVKHVFYNERFTVTSFLSKPKAGDNGSLKRVLSFLFIIMILSTIMIKQWLLAISCTIIMGIF